MPLRRQSRVLKQQLGRLPAVLSTLARLVLWAFRTDARGIATIAILFAIGMAVQYLLPTDLENIYGVATAGLVLLIFGTFLGVIVVTEDNKKYETSGSWIRVISGAVAFSAIAALLSAPLIVIALGALVGVMLGYAGIYWARHL
jgi:hypothetical protein